VLSEDRFDAMCNRSLSSSASVGSKKDKMRQTLVQAVAVSGLMATATVVRIHSSGHSFAFQKIKSKNEGSRDETSVPAH
jgi:hypothetical protein